MRHWCGGGPTHFLAHAFGKATNAGHTLFLEGHSRRVGADIGDGSTGPR